MLIPTQLYLVLLPKALLAAPTLAPDAGLPHRLGPPPVRPCEWVPWSQGVPDNRLSSPATMLMMTTCGPTVRHET